MAELTAKIDITTKITEENDRFIFETIYPFCCEKAQMVLKKSDLEEALLIWKAYKDGRLEWKPIPNRYLAKMEDTGYAE